VVGLNQVAPQPGAFNTDDHLAQELQQRQRNDPGPDVYPRNSTAQPNAKNLSLIREEGAEGLQEASRPGPTQSSSAQHSDFTLNRKALPSSPATNVNSNKRGGRGGGGRGRKRCVTFDPDTGAGA